MLQGVATLRELSFSIDEILTMQRTPGAIPSIVEARRDAARTQHETAENAYAVLGRLDPNGVSDVTALAARVREAAAYRPHPTPPPCPSITKSRMRFPLCAGPVRPMAGSPGRYPPHF